MSPRGRSIYERSSGARALRHAAGALCLLLGASAAHAYTITLAAAAPKTIYLQVGVGSFTGTYCGNNCTYVPPIARAPGSKPRNNTTINTVSVSVAASAVGNGTAQAMTTDSTQANSFFDGRAFCDALTQVYIGSFYRTNTSGTATGTVTATVPASLTDAAGDTIPFSQISWNSGGNGDNGAEPYPGGSFTGTSQVVGTVAQNQWAESCWTFSYKNTLIPPGGTYTGRVLYTLTAP
jgi:hypothetical protein